MFAYTHTKSGLTHACDGTVMEDGTQTAWRICDGAHVTAAALVDGQAITCPTCRKMQDGARILALPTLAFGPPDLIAGSLPQRRYRRS